MHLTDVLRGVLVTSFAADPFWLDGEMGGGACAPTTWRLLASCISLILCWRGLLSLGIGRCPQASQRGLLRKAVTAVARRWTAFCSLKRATCVMRSWRTCLNRAAAAAVTLASKKVRCYLHERECVCDRQCVCVCVCVCQSVCVSVCVAAAVVAASVVIPSLVPHCLAFLQAQLRASQRICPPVATGRGRGRGQARALLPQRCIFRVANSSMQTWSLVPMECVQLFEECLG